ncbi:MAG: hypothetical protein HKN32_00930 [Flavobacteriales bacterium]|nr:hypothetical protein [Flavobacteriales bacterium]
MPLRTLTFVVFLLCLSGCKKEDPVVFTDNTIPPYAEIPTVVVQNYINRVYIDVLGREPLDSEMESETVILESANLSSEARYDMVNKLMFNQDWVEGDSSYNYAYFLKIYEDSKARLIEGSSDDYLNQQYNLFYGQAIADSINGNWVDYQRNKAEAEKIELILDSREEYRASEITIDEMYRRMMNNSVYDQINMNTFNFVNASFDDLYFRFPTTAEFESAFVIIENNEPEVIFGQIASNKSEYLNILTTTAEYKEGIIRWAYLSLLGREAASNEVFELIADFQLTHDVQEVQKQIMISDEYAGFD